MVDRSSSSPYDRGLLEAEGGRRKAISARASGACKVGQTVGADGGSRLGPVWPVPVARRLGGFGAPRPATGTGCTGHLAELARQVALVGVAARRWRSAARLSSPCAQPGDHPVEPEQPQQLFRRRSPSSATDQGPGSWRGLSERGLGEGPRHGTRPPLASAASARPATAQDGRRGTLLRQLATGPTAGRTSSRADPVSSLRNAFVQLGGLRRRAPRGRGRLEPRQLGRLATEQGPRGRAGGTAAWMPACSLGCSHAGGHRVQAGHDHVVRPSRGQRRSGPPSSTVPEEPAPGRRRETMNVKKVRRRQAAMAAGSSPRSSGS